MLDFFSLSAFLIITASLTWGVMGAEGQNSSGFCVERQELDFEKGSLKRGYIVLYSTNVPMAHH